MNFDKALEIVISLEGGYKLEKNPTESEVTYAGIYRKAFPNWEGWKYIDKGDVPPKESIANFYKKNFWDGVPCRSPIVQFLLFEFGINAGLGTAKKIAASIRSDYESITDEDDVRQFVLEFCLLRIKRYLEICNKNPKQYGLYLRGWLNRTFKALEADA